MVCPTYALPRCPPPHHSPSVFWAPKEALLAFQHFVFTKIPRVFLPTFSLSVMWKPISQMEKPRNPASEHSLTFVSKPAGTGSPVLRISIPRTNLYRKNTCVSRLAIRSPT